jgi:hypothetical protein
VGWNGDEPITHHPPRIKKERGFTSWLTLISKVFNQLYRISSLSSVFLLADSLITAFSISQDKSELLLSA